MGTPKKISVITCTNRPGGLELINIALKRQTHKMFEWIVIAPKGYDIGDANVDILLEDPPKEEGDYWSLYKAYNKAIAAASGDYILSVQDFTFFDPDAMRKLYFNAKDNRLITGFGHKYDKVYPERGAVIWEDIRASDSRSLIKCPFHWIEFNFALFPKQAIYDIGGFDEYLDKFSGMCGYDIVDRLDMVGGYEFMIDHDLETYSIEHGRPPMWEESNGIHGEYQKRREKYLDNPVLFYL